MTPIRNAARSAAAVAVTAALTVSLTPAATATITTPPASPSSSPHDRTSPTVQERRNLAAIQGFFTQVLSQRRIDLVDRYIAPDFVQHNPQAGTNRDDFKATLPALWVGFPDLTVGVQKVLADGDRVIVLNQLDGNNTGSLFGQPPTGRKFSQLNADLYRLRNGKIVEHWDVMDFSALLPFGVTPPTTSEPSQTDFTSRYTRRERSNIALVNRFFDDVINGHHAERFTAYVRPDYIQHQPAFGNTPQEVVNTFKGLFAGFPDTTVRNEHVLAFGDEVVIINTVSGTNTGPFAGKPPTGRTLTYRAADWFRIQDGKVAEHWAAADYTSLFSFLG